MARMIQFFLTDNTLFSVLKKKQHRTSMLYPSERLKPELLDLLNKGIKAIQGNGRDKQINQKWLENNQDVS